MKKIFILILILLNVSWVPLKNKEKALEKFIKINENVEKKYTFSKNVGKYIFSKKTSSKNLNVIGSAVFVKDYYGFVTEHGLRINQILSINFDDEIISAKVVLIVTDDYGIDTGILIFDKRPKNAIDLKYHSVICTNDNITLFGFPQGEKKIKFAKFLFMEAEKLILTKAVEQGMSGGLAINEKNEAVGVIVGYSLRNKKNEWYFKKNNIIGDNISIIVNIDHIFYYINRISQIDKK